MSSLEGKVALITGSGRHKGLGQAMARAIAKEGGSVVLSDLGSEQGAKFTKEHIGLNSEMSEIIDEILKNGGNASGVACNVLHEEEVKNAISYAVKEYGKLDILINNAGIGYLMEKIDKLNQSDWDTVLNVNLRGAFFGIKHAAIQMALQGQGGTIINIASQAAKRGFPGAAAYVSSKHALVGLTRTAALEFAKENIRVNSICPNHVTTGLGDWQNKHFSSSRGFSEKDYLKAMRERIPLGRVGKTDDIANMCVFLCSDKSAYITGQNLDVSGGEEMH
ncbi:MAG: 3-oxoacyl-[acyl-carrier-protein] reductase FabG [Alphaproteobacteria bacterium MarineAlpha2_Bin1]|nr:MAG: 3-oxoacyl-[acyl-carrier-protein] reductase FabG [Alphaproteobacteria bacterium MarineAlpha2_Bin1]